MKDRTRTLPTPADEPPYFRVNVPGRGEFVLRTPSLHRVAQVAKATNVRSIAALMAVLSTGAGPLGALKVAQEGGAELLELVGALIGLAWADPVHELEAAPLADYAPTEVLRYGAAVYEELDADGWRFEHLVVCALAIGEQVVERSSITTEVLEKARGFAGRTAPTTAPSSKSSPSSSTDDASTS